MAQLKADSTVGGKGIANVDDLNALGNIVANKADDSDIPIKISYGGTFYVDPNTGNDSNDGSAGTPWATLQAVADKFNNTLVKSDVIIKMSPGIVAPSIVMFQNIIVQGTFWFVGTDLDFTDLNYNDNVPITTNVIWFRNCRGHHTIGSFSSLLADYSFSGDATSGAFIFLGCKFLSALYILNSSLGVNKCLFNGSSAGGNSSLGIYAHFNSFFKVEASCEFNGFIRAMLIKNSFANILGCSGTGNDIGVDASEGSFVINLASVSLGATTPNVGGVIFKSMAIFE